jgi:2,4-dichlorophenol 6-monooxygenase
VTEGGLRVSTLDLVGRGAFSVVTGIGGEAWLEAAAQLADKIGMTITPVSIGPGQPYEDPYGTWADLREIEDGGVLLVRPDLHIAARSLTGPASAQQAYGWLAEALSAVLQREV